MVWLYTDLIIPLECVNAKGVKRCKKEEVKTVVDRFSSVHVFLVRALISISFLVLPACATDTVSASPQILPPCDDLPPIEINPYLSFQQLQRQSGAMKIYSDYKYNFNNFDDARRRAFTQLGESTKYLSDYVDVAIDNTRMVRITVTYISPALVEYIILNNVFSPDINLTGDDPETFKSRVYTVLNKLAERKETLFLVIVTAPSYTGQAYGDQVLTVKIPLDRMALINGSNLVVYPIHDDHVLAEFIDITHEPVAGIIGYPIAVSKQEICTWVIDQYTNVLTMDVPSISLGGTQIGQQFWNIPYRPLIEMDTVNLYPVYDPSMDLGRIHFYTEPPKPYWGPGTADSTNWKNYWEEMGGYIWNLLYFASR